jgi:hypothetical protein
MNQKPLFADLMSERQPFLGLTFWRTIVMIGCLAILTTGVMVFNPFGLLDGQNKNLKSSQKDQVQKMVVKVQNLEEEISKKQAEVFTLLSKYKRKTGKELSYLNLLNLTDEEKKLLENRIKQEKRISIKSLLETILEKTRQVSNLQKSMAAVEEKMPEPIRVTQGENHYQVALNFLVKEQGMGKEDAARVVEQAILFENLMPGFKVWNFYDNGEFGTFVTQGDASISPGQLQRMLKQQLISQKNRVLAERDKLSEDVTLLKTNNKGLNDRLTRLNQENAQLAGKYSLLDEQYKALEKQWNSLFYRLDLEKYLVERGIIKRGFLKKSNLNRFTAIDFESSIDLRESKQIHVPAARFNAGKIKNVVLYPRLFKKGIDYEVSMDNQSSGAVLTILNPEKLKNERVVISVGL